MVSVASMLNPGRVLVKGKVDVIVDSGKRVNQG